MKVLFLAPQPFYQERGTPIAVDLAVRVLEEEGHKVELLTYPGGENRNFKTVRHLRVLKLPFISNIPMGFSWKKIIYSSIMFFSALRLLLKNRYQIIHAVEESVFIAMLLGWVFRTPYIYDMDSSLVGQLLDKKPSLKPLKSILSKFEAAAVRRARSVVAVCPALVELAKQHKAKSTLLLTDISLLDRYTPGKNITYLNQVVPGQGSIFLYVGNLETYQGIDLLLEGWSIAQKQGVQARLAVIGGRPEHVAYYRNKCLDLGISESTIFLGPRPVADIAAYLEQADVVVSPRTQGNNTPMKIYTYLDSGRALLATAIDSHTQVINDSFARLVEPTPDAMAKGISELATNPSKRLHLAQLAKKEVEEQYSHEVFHRKLASFYSDIETGNSF